MFAFVRGRLISIKINAIADGAFTSVRAYLPAAGQFVGIFVGIVFFRLLTIPTETTVLVMPLSDLALRNAKPARKAFKLSDGGGG